MSHGDVLVRSCLKPSTLCSQHCGGIELLFPIHLRLLTRVSGQLLVTCLTAVQAGRAWLLKHMQPTLTQVLAIGLGLPCPRLCPVLPQWNQSDALGKAPARGRHEDREYEALACLHSNANQRVSCTFLPDGLCTCAEFRVGQCSKGLQPLYWF